MLVKGNNYGNNQFKVIKGQNRGEQNGQQFYDGDGLVLKGVENTIRNYGYLGRVAVHETNTEIIHMMIQH